MTKKELFEALDGLRDDTHIHVWRDHDIYTDIDVDIMTALDPLPSMDPVAFINIHDDPDNVIVKKYDMQNMQQALMLADMFFLATPIGTIEKSGNPLGKVLSEAINICEKYVDQ